MSRTYTELMQAVMNEQGGDFLPEADFVRIGYRMLLGQGNDLSEKSARNNLLNHNKLEAAGLVKVSIGKSVFVMRQDAASGLMNGESVVAAAPSPASQPAIEVPEGGSFYGIERLESPEDPLLAAMIPKVIGYKESDKREFRRLANCYKRRKHVMLVGPTGSGKTALANDFFAQINKPYVRVNCSEGLDEFQLVGHMSKDAEGKIVFVPGFLHMAMTHGIGIVLDEVNAMEQSVKTILHGAMDFGYLSVPYNNNEIVHAHEDFFVIGCINPPEDYAGMKEMNQATLSRFRWVEHVDYLPEDTEVQVIMEQSGVHNPVVARMVVRLANDVRASKKAGEIGWDCSTRNLIDALSFSTDDSLQVCIEACLINRCPVEDRDVIEGVCRARISGWA
jgi:MoxR-like ATPase